MRELGGGSWGGGEGAGGSGSTKGAWLEALLSWVVFSPPQERQ